ncbi:MAG: threonine/serine exporter family protein [Christensenellales bacterium]
MRCDGSSSRRLSGRAFVRHSLSCAAQATSCAVCGAVAWGCYLLAAPLGLFLATTLAAIALTLLSRMLSIAMKMPSTVFIVTGIFPLVPGAGIYHTAYALVSRNMEAFTLRGMQTLALAGAIALGILIGMGFPKLLVELGGHALEKLPLCHREARP